MAALGLKTRVKRVVAIALLVLATAPLVLTARSATGCANNNPQYPSYTGWFIGAPLNNDTFNTNSTIGAGGGGPAPVGGAGIPYRLRLIGPDGKVKKISDGTANPAGGWIPATSWGQNFAPTLGSSWPTGKCKLQVTDQYAVSQSDPTDPSPACVWAQVEINIQ